MYGQIVRPFGSGRFEVVCSDSLLRVCKIRGSLHKRVWIQPNDIVLVLIRENEPHKGDIILKYFPPEVKILRDNKHIPDNFMEEAEKGVNLEFDNI